LQTILTPTPARRSLAKRVVSCLVILLGIRHILWPEVTPSNGATVRRRLFSFLSRKQREAPQRGKGAYLRRFIEHVQAVTRRYAKGLFHCYDDPRIPQTSNALEGLNGLGKHNLRRCAGRSSTANGPGSSCGRIYMFGVALHACMPLDELNSMLQEVPIENYRRAHAHLEEIRAPSARRRAMLRNPQKHLAGILQRWRDP